MGRQLASGSFLRRNGVTGQAHGERAVNMACVGRRGPAGNIVRADDIVSENAQTNGVIAA